MSISISGLFRKRKPTVSLFHCFGDIGDQLDKPVTVTPFIVVPDGNFDEVSADDFGQKKMDDTRVAIANIISGNERFFANGKDALVERFGSGFLKCVIDLVDGYIA